MAFNLNFTLPDAIAGSAIIYITLAQKSRELLAKTESQTIVSGSAFSITISDDEEAVLEEYDTTLALSLRINNIAYVFDDFSFYLQYGVDVDTEYSDYTKKPIAQIGLMTPTGSTGGGGSGGTTDYTELSNKPKINSVELSGNKSLSALGAEATANKVTSISSSSTDSQYPSAKCVYSLIGDIESALDVIIGGGA